MNRELKRKLKQIKRVDKLKHRQWIVNLCAKTFHLILTAPIREWWTVDEQA